MDMMIRHQLAAAPSAPLVVGVGCRQAQAVVTVPRCVLGGQSCISFA